jgi:K+-sensing histidine kinase KdpD
MLRQKQNGLEGRMRMMTPAMRLAVSLTVVSLVTVILWYFRWAGAGPLHPVFFYLLPVALLAMFVGRLPALLCASLAAVCSAYFLYDPMYSFQVTNRLEVGDLVCFAVLALIGIHCTGEILRPPAKVPAFKAPNRKP